MSCWGSLKCAFTCPHTANGCDNISGFVLQSYVRQHQWPFWLSWGLSLVAIIALGCSRTLRYKVPYNYMFLVRFAASFQCITCVT